MTHCDDHRSSQHETGTASPRSDTDAITASADALHARWSVRRWIGYLAFVILTVLLLGELAVRGLVCVRTPPGMAFDDELIFSFEPHTTVYGVALNGMGAIGDDVEPRDTTGQPLRVFLFGGSTSFAQAYVDDLRRELAPRWPGVTVTSFGKPRYTSYQSRVLAQRLLPAYRPDIVVVYHAINDTIYDTFWWVSEAPDVGYFDWRELGPPMLARVVGYQVIDKRIRSTPSFPPGPLRSEAILRGNVERIIAAARSTGAKVVLPKFAIALPTADEPLRRRVATREAAMRHFWGNVDATVRAVGAHNLVFAGLANEYGLEIADVVAAVPRTSSYFHDLCHLTPAGNERLAHEVAAAIARAMSDGASNPTGRR